MIASLRPSHQQFATMFAYVVRLGVNGEVAGQATQESTRDSRSSPLLHLRHWQMSVKRLPSTLRFPGNWQRFERNSSHIETKIEPYYREMLWCCLVQRLKLRDIHASVILDSLQSAIHNRHIGWSGNRSRHNTTTVAMQYESDETLCL